MRKLLPTLHYSLYIWFNLIIKRLKYFLGLNTKLSKQYTYMYTFKKWKFLRIPIKWSNKISVLCLNFFGRRGDTDLDRVHKARICIIIPFILLVWETDNRPNVAAYILAVLHIWASIILYNVSRAKTCQLRLYKIYLRSKSILNYLPKHFATSLILEVEH